MTTASRKLRLYNRWRVGARKIYKSPGVGSSNHTVRLPNFVPEGFFAGDPPRRPRATLRFPSVPLFTLSLSPLPPPPPSSAAPIAVLAAGHKP
jgi:hypothetical protein